MTKIESLSPIIERLNQLNKSQISEEELFHEVVATLASERGLTLTNGSERNLEARTVNSLKNEGSDAAWKLYQTAFTLSQLDSNKQALFDDTGSATDHTIAVTSITDAIAKLEANHSRLSDLEILSSASWDKASAKTARSHAVNQIAGDLNTLSNSTNASSSSATTGNDYSTSFSYSLEDSGFLFKPRSESDGNLVILLPQSLTNQISEVNVIDLATGEIKGQGRFSAVANEGREHYRFDFTGDSLKVPVEVQVKLKNEQILTKIIEDPSERTET